MKEVILCGLLAKNIAIIVIIKKSNVRYSSSLCRSKWSMFTLPYNFLAWLVRALQGKEA